MNTGISTTALTALGALEAEIRVLEARLTRAESVAWTFITNLEKGRDDVEFLQAIRDYAAKEARQELLRRDGSMRAKR